MSSDFRQSRLARLRSAQNADGGWGYYTGKQSWLEPTCYALFALYEPAQQTPEWTRGWNLVRSWQHADGGFRAGAGVPNESWATALVVSLHCVRNVNDAVFQKAIAWMLSTKGIEGGWLERTINAVRPMPVEYDRRWRGWPWCPNASSWIEPTAHSLVALKKVAQKQSASGLAERVDDAERMILDRRSPDGGWNYGNRRVLNTDLPSYPETTGIALLGLQGSRLGDLRPAVDIAKKQLSDTRSRLAKAWLTISLRNFDVAVPEVAEAPVSPDLMLTAVEALACPNGGHQWLKIA